MFLKKGDLDFIAKLSLKVDMVAKPYSDEKGQYWVLEVITHNEGAQEKSVLIGARGSERKFRQLNAINSLLKEAYGKGVSFKVML